MLLQLIGRLNQPTKDAYSISEIDARRVADNGLGPIFWALLQEGHVEASSQSIELLQSADMTARVISARTRKNIDEVLGVLESAGLEPVVLKGADVAQRFYPEPHWRVMGDLDLLLPNDTGHEALRLLEAEGFRNPTDHPAERWDGHHHVVPVYHPDLKQWVEVHHRLITDQSPFHVESIFQGESVRKNLKSEVVGGRTVRFLTPTLTRLHTIVHWYFDLMDRWGNAGLQRPILDSLFMRRAGVAKPEEGLSEEIERACQLMDYILNRLEGRTASEGLWWPLPGNLAQIDGLSSEDSALQAELAGAAFGVYLVAKSRLGFKANLMRAWASVAINAVGQRLMPRQSQRL
ncbi:MAG: nucleotidyltransferase family protein [Pseudomonadota bacterium]